MVWIALAALAAVVLTPTEAFRAAGWVDHLGVLSLFALGGLVAGGIAARTPLRAFAAHVLVLGIGFELAVVRYAQLAPGDDWGTRLQGLYTRVFTWIDAALRGGTSSDNLMFALTLALLSWAIGYFGAWYLLRARSPWWGIVPAGVVLLLNASYDTALLPYFYVYLAASLLLLVVVNEWTRREEFVRRRAPVEVAVLRTGLLGAAAVAAPLLLLAWQFPPLNADDQIGEAWTTAGGPLLPVQNRLERMFSAVQARQGGVRALAFAKTMSPRSAFELGQTPLLAVRAGSPQYWRANTLDEYSGQNMASSPVLETDVGPGDLVANAPRYRGREDLLQHVQVLATQTSALFAADQPVHVEFPTVMEFRGTPLDFASMRLPSPLRKGDEYVVTSSVSTASAEDLRAASTVYPDWSARYLQLPPDLPPRVRSEAARVVGDASTSYDKALRIEAYLRTFPYTTTDVPIPPEGRDWVDYMLFDAKRGYCDYYATAMAVMLRSEGVPARVAQGFATGEWIPERQYYLVRESQAHSWVEAFFPEYGWIVFEPSASRPVPFRVERSLDAGGLPPMGLPGSQEPLQSPDTEALREMREQGTLDGDQAGVVAGVNLFGLARAILLVVVALVVIAGVLGGLGFLVWTYGLRGLAWHQRLYVQTVRLASWCGLALTGNQTPYEQARAVGDQIPGAAPLTESIAEAYVAGTYGRGATEAQREGSSQAWRRLRLLLPRATVPRLMRRLLGARPSVTNQRWRPPRRRVSVVKR